MWNESRASLSCYLSCKEALKQGQTWNQSMACLIRLEYCESMVLKMDDWGKTNMSRWKYQGCLSLRHCWFRTTWWSQCKIWRENLQAVGSYVANIQLGGINWSAVGMWQGRKRGKGTSTLFSSRNSRGSKAQYHEWNTLQGTRPRRKSSAVNN